MGRIIFVTGTGTGVGKTAVSALLLEYCIRHGQEVKGVKPFCTGERTDAELLRDLQYGNLPLHEVNPFYFAPALSPWTAARLEGRIVRLEETLNVLKKQAKDCKLLIVEGAGGLLSPLGERFNAANLITRLDADVLLIAANKLGVLNEVVLATEALKGRGINRVKVVLVNHSRGDASSQTNFEDLKLLLANEVHAIPFMEGFRPEADFVRKSVGPVAELLHKLL